MNRTVTPPSGDHNRIWTSLSWDRMYPNNSVQRNNVTFCEYVNAHYSELSLVHYTDQTKLSLAIINRFERAGYEFWHAYCANHNRVTLTKRKSSFSEKLGYLKTIYNSMAKSDGTQLSVKEDLKHLEEQLTSIKDLQPREYPKDYAFNCCHKLEPGALLLDKEGTGATCYGQALLPANIKFLHEHLDFTQFQDAENKAVYFSASICKALDHSRSNRGYTLKPYEWLYVLVVDTSKLKPNEMIASWLIRQNTTHCDGIWRYEGGELPILEVIGFQAGSNGNLSDKDGTVATLRKNGNIRKPVFERLK